MVTLLYYPRNASRLPSMVLAPSILISSHVSIDGRVRIVLGFRRSDLIEALRRGRPDPRPAAAAILAAKLASEEDLTMRERLEAANRLDRALANSKISAFDAIIAASVARGLGLDVTVFLHNDPILTRFNRVFSAVIRRGTRLDVGRLETRLLEITYDLFRETERLRSLEVSFDALAGLVEDYADYDFEPPEPKPAIETYFEADPVVMSVHDSRDPRTMKAPYLLSSRGAAKRISFVFGTSRRLNPMLSRSAMFLLEEASYATFELMKSATLMESAAGYDPRYSMPTGYSPKLSDLVEPGVLYGVLADYALEDLYEVLFDQMNGQTLLPSDVVLGRLISVNPRTYGSESLYFEASEKRIIEEVLSGSISENRSIETNFFFGFVINARRFRRTGRLLGEADAGSARNGRPGRITFGNVDPSGVSILDKPEFLDGTIKARVGDVNFYVYSESKPREIDADACVDSGGTAAYFSNGKGRCADEAFDSFYRDPFLLERLEDIDMDVERRITPTVVALLLGFYSLLKPRAYIKYETSPMGSTAITSVKFYVQSFGAFSRSSAGAASLVIALVVIIARLIGPIVSGDRPTAYLSLISLALTFYIGAIIGLFSRNYDYLFSLKYTTKFLAENEGTFMMYTVTVAEGGRALILGLVFLTISLILEAYHVRKSA